uniref:Large ribosomal subunit protein uL16m n=1 Tax=Romanomermis culicivorax TaxID=13658 RepID=A0A915HV39_ROMCU
MHFDIVSYVHVGPIYLRKIEKVYAVTGGMLQYKHLELIRTRVNKLLNEYELFKDAFAVWRVDAPWLPRPKKSKGSKMGGGKSKVHHFVTPVRSGRILFEFGGHIVEDQARQAIECLAERVPFEARFVSQAILLQEKENEMIARRNNKNRFTTDFCMKWNMHNCSEHLSPYDYVWGGQYR